MQRSVSTYRQILICIGFIITWHTARAQRQMEYLDRGLVAIHQSDSAVLVSWRLLITDARDISFNLYRQSGADTIRLNDTPLRQATCFSDSTFNPSLENTYFLKEVHKGREKAPGKPFVLAANSPVRPYIPIPLRFIDGYTPNDVSVGDLDGDGEYEIVLHQSGRPRDNSHDGFTDPPVFQAYKLDGTLMWTINLGINIREGAHYTQFMVYDLDGDGKAEFACKTADGTVDGQGRVIGDSTKDWRNQAGRILQGPEFLSVFSGETGAVLATTQYIPTRDPLEGWGGTRRGSWDSKGNRADRFLACVAYLDGKRPSLVMCRGYYGRSVLAAWDFRNGKLSSRWVFDSKDGNNPYSGMGNHNLSVADVDEDGKDEIVYGSMVVDHDGKGLYTTGLGHGDALHVSDFDPSRPGLEVFGIHERPSGPGAALFDAATGTLLWRGAEKQDIGRGVAANIDAANPGGEMWFLGSGGLLDMKGNRIGEYPASTNFLIWWDGDFTRELLNGNRIDKYNQGTLFTANGAVSNNGTKSTPALSADILGDWREELILRSEDNKELRIYISSIPTPHRTYTFMHDPQYRLSVAWQNTGYNQPPHTSFYVGEDMKPAPRHSVRIVKPKNARNETNR